MKEKLLKSEEDDYKLIKSIFINQMSRPEDFRFLFLMSFISYVHLNAVVQNFKWSL